MPGVWILQLQAAEAAMNMRHAPTHEFPSVFVQLILCWFIVSHGLLCRATRVSCLLDHRIIVLFVLLGPVAEVVGGCAASRFSLPLLRR